MLPVSTPFLAARIAALVSAENSGSFARAAALSIVSALFSELVGGDADFRDTGACDYAAMIFNKSALWAQSLRYFVTQRGRRDTDCAIIEDGQTIRKRSAVLIERFHFNTQRGHQSGG